jgi:hypothetical protein
MYKCQHIGLSKKYYSLIDETDHLAALAMELKKADSD